MNLRGDANVGDISQWGAVEKMRVDKNMVHRSGQQGSLSKVPSFGSLHIYYTYLFMLVIKFFRS